MVGTNVSQSVADHAKPNTKLFTRNRQKIVSESGDYPDVGVRTTITVQGKSSIASSARLRDRNKPLCRPWPMTSISGLSRLASAMMPLASSAWIVSVCPTVTPAASIFSRRPCTVRCSVRRRLATDSRTLSGPAAYPMKPEGSGGATCTTSTIAFIRRAKRSASARTISPRSSRSTATSIVNGSIAIGYNLMT